MDPLGNRNSLGYDAASRLISQTNPLGYIATTVYDIANRLVATVDALGNRTTFGLRRGESPGQRDQRTRLRELKRV